MIKSHRNWKHFVDHFLDTNYVLFVGDKNLVMLYCFRDGRFLIHSIPLIELASLLNTFPDNVHDQDAWWDIKWFDFVPEPIEPIDIVKELT